MFSNRVLLDSGCAFVIWTTWLLECEWGAGVNTCVLVFQRSTYSSRSSQKHALLWMLIINIPRSVTKLCTVTTHECCHKPFTGTSAHPYDYKNTRIFLWCGDWGIRDHLICIIQNHKVANKCRGIRSLMCFICEWSHSQWLNARNWHTVCKPEIK